MSNLDDQKRPGTSLDFANPVELHQILFEEATDWIFLTNPEWHIMETNCQGSAITGYSHQELLGMTYMDMIPPEDLALAPLMIDVLQNGFIATKERNFCRKDGSLVPVEIRARMLRKGNILGIVRDITERKRIEERLQQEILFNKTTIDSLPGLFYLFDEQGKFLRWNTNFETVSGYSSVELAALTPGDFFEGRDREMICSAVDLVFKTGEAWVEADFISKDHTRTSHLFSGRLFQFKGRKCLIGMGVDITDRKKAEEERKKLQEQLTQAHKMESVGRLAGGVAHDFNNMLGVILGHTEMAQAQLNPAQPLFTHLQEIGRAAKRSADLTRQLLAFARKQTVEPKVLDLNEIVSGMITMLRRLIGEDINLTWMPGNGLSLIKIDPSQIDQILVNLCVNARDAIRGTGKVLIETGTTVIDEAYCSSHMEYIPGEFVLLAVSDDGCGMDKETLSHLFEPFFTTKEVSKGTGLGMATVYGIVKQNSGFINVYSERGKGTTVKIYFSPHSPGTQRPPKGEAVQPAPCGGRETILLVEDEPMILKMASTMLELQGYVVIPASSPAEAIRLASEHAGKIHLLLTDVIMPEMNGKDLAKVLLAISPDLKILFTSGYTANVIARHGVLDEGVQFIQKPFTIQDLTAKIRRVFDRDR